MKSLLEGYLESRRHLVSAGTLQAESYYLKLFESFCVAVGITGLEQVEERHLAAYHHQLLSRPGKKGTQLSSSFRCKALRTVQKLFRWAVKHRFLVFSVEQFTVPRRTEQLPRVPNVEEVRRLFRVTEETTPKGLRDRMILELLYGLGLRVCECHRLDLEHLDWADRNLVIHGKGGHRRRLPMGQKLVECGLRYLAQARPELAQPDEKALLVSLPTGLRLGRQSIYLRVKARVRQAGLTLRPHQLRHACATHMLARGANLRRLQEFLGHARCESTQRYARICPRELHQEFRRCHPRALL